MKQFDEELTSLKGRVIEMGRLSQEMITLAVDALVKHDGKAIKEVRASEKVTDRLQVEIDDDAIRLIAVYTPVAHDLRFLLMAGRISLELERIGDQARNMCKYVKLFFSQPNQQTPEELPQMAHDVCRMLHDSIEAFDQEDAERAIEIMKTDKVVDDLDHKLFNGVATELAETSDLTRTVALVLLSRSLERIGDLVTNICEEIVYLVDAKDIRHTI
ncbi:MAG TPA: phosphate signaling complex protein PhoU [Nitrospirales bacterium]|nr:phosphate signaling complex protein PhoU [Nitrospirales bacterium]